MEVHGEKRRTVIEEKQTARRIDTLFVCPALQVRIARENQHIQTKLNSKQREGQAGKERQTSFSAKEFP